MISLFPLILLKLKMQDPPLMIQESNMTTQWKRKN